MASGVEDLSRFSPDFLLHIFSASAQSSFSASVSFSPELSLFLPFVMRSLFYLLIVLYLLIPTQQFKYINILSKTNYRWHKYATTEDNQGVEDGFDNNVQNQQKAQIERQQQQIDALMELMKQVRPIHTHTLFNKDKLRTTMQTTMPTS